MPGTGRLIDQFCEAAETWARGAGAQSREIAFDVLVLTGAGDRYPGIGAVDTSRMSPAQIAKLPIGDLHGWHSMEQARDWLTKITGNKGFDEEFLVLSLIAAVDRRLEEQSEGYARGIARAREHNERLRAILNDPAETKRTLDAMNRHPMRMPGGTSLTEPMTEGDLIAMAETADTWARPSLVDQRERHRRVEIWRNAVAPILDRDNLICVSTTKN